MRSVPEPLCPTDLDQFRRDGFVVVREAFARADAAEMERRWWAELEAAHGIQRDDRSTWRQPRGDLKRAKRDPIQAKILTERVRGVLDDLLGKDEWPAPRDWGRTIATFPEPGEWDVPTHLWHWDNLAAWHREKLNALFVVSFIGEVAPRGGGTLVLAGSPVSSTTRSGTPSTSVSEPMKRATRSTGDARFPVSASSHGCER